MNRIKQLVIRQKGNIGASFIVALAFGGLYIYWTPEPRMVIYDQTIQSGQLTAAQVDLPVDGWLVLSATKYEQATEEVGRVRVGRGRHKNIGVYVNVLKTSPTLEAVLYEDGQTPGTFDKETDQFITNKSGIVRQLFNRL